MSRTRRGDQMQDRQAKMGDLQAEQRILVEQARALPGVAEVMDTYGRLSAYTHLIVNVQPDQVRNATGGNG